MSVRKSRKWRLAVDAASCRVFKRLEAASTAGCPGNASHIRVKKGVRRQESSALLSTFPCLLSIFGRSLLKGLLFVFLVAACLLAGRQAAAMFVSPPDEEDSVAKAGEDAGGHESAAAGPPEVAAGETPPQPSQTQPGVTQGTRPAPPSAGSPQEDQKLRDQFRGIYVDPPRRKAVNSRTFDRMSGKTEAFGSVVVPAAEARTRGDPSATIKEPPSDPQERAFSIGSWLFILVCVAAAGVALLRIRRLSGSS